MGLSGTSQGGLFWAQADYFDYQEDDTMKKSFLLRDIPQELHRELKLAAVRQQITMRELILRLMADHVEKRGAAHGR